MATLNTTTSVQGTLTTSLVTLYTAGAGVKEVSVEITFENYSGSSVTVEIFSNGTADVNRVGTQAYTLLTKEMMVLFATLAPNDDIRAKASAGTSVVYRLPARSIS